MNNHNSLRSGLRAHLLAACLIAALLSAGCAVSPAAKRIDAFSAATSVAATNTNEAFETVEKSYYEMQVKALVIDYDTKGFHPESIRPFLSDEDLEARTKVLEGLKQYAQKLSDIMGDKQLDEFDSQTKAFGQSLVQLKDNAALKKIAAAIPNADINIFTTAVDTLGRWFINYKRQKNVPKIVSDMQKPVQDICTLLVADIGKAPDSTGTGGSGLRDQLWRQYTQMMMLQDAFIGKNKFDPRTKAQEIAKLPALVSEQEKADETLKATQATLTKLAETHKELGKAFEKTSPTLEQLIRELVAEAGRVKGFYEGLGKK